MLKQFINAYKNGETIDALLKKLKSKDNEIEKLKQQKYDTNQNDTRWISAIRMELDNASKELKQKDKELKVATAENELLKTKLKALIAVSDTIDVLIRANEELRKGYVKQNAGR